MFVANNREELFQFLKQSDITVPPRDQGRTKVHTERYCLFRLLATFVEEKQLEYPLIVHHDDRPDFTLESPGWIVGVEHTEAVPENKAHKDRLWAEVAPNKMLFSERYVPGEKRKPAKVLIREIEENDAGYVWPGNSVERDWAKVIEYFLDDKIAAINKPGFRIFNENWLLIYDNWPSPVLDLQLGVGYLRESVCSKLDQSPWDRLFIITHHTIVEVSSQEAIFYEVRELWT